QCRHPPPHPEWARLERPTQNLSGRPPDGGSIHVMFVLCVRSEERTVADGVDEPGDAARGAMRSAHGRLVEDLALLTRDLHSVPDVGARILLGERLEVKAGPDPLGQLHEVYQFGRANGVWVRV